MLCFRESKGLDVAVGNIIFNRHRQACSPSGLRGAAGAER